MKIIKVRPNNKNKDKNLGMSIFYISFNVDKYINILTSVHEISTFSTMLL